jgi:hypothetical protein
MFGKDVRKQFVRAVVTRWGDNPFTLGSYSYSRPRDLDAPFAKDEPRSPGERRSGAKRTWHQLMFEPVAGADGLNKLHFAGEAVGRNRRLASRYNGSVALAEYSGQDAARDIIKELRTEK